MDKRSMRLVENAFVAEIDTAMGVGLGLMQTKSKLVAKLVEEGYLTREQETIHGRFAVTVEGYRLTHLGRMTYCRS